MIGISTCFLGSKEVILSDNVEYSVISENLKLVNNVDEIDSNRCTFCLYDW